MTNPQVDVHPQNMVERTFAILVLIFGLVLFSPLGDKMRVSRHIFHVAASEECVLNLHLKWCCLQWLTVWLCPVGLTGDLIWRAGWVGLGTAPGGNRWQKANRMCSIGPVPLLKA